MALSNTAKNLMLDELGSVAVYVSLHDDDPGSNGSNEISGGSPAYARKSVTWNSAANGNLDSSNTPEFDVPASTTVTHFGLWSAATSGTYYGGGALSAPEAFAGQGKYTLTDLDVDLDDPT